MFKVKDQENGHSIEKNIEYYWNVREKDFFRSVALEVSVYEIKVTEYAEHDEWYRKAQFNCSEFFNGRGGKRVYGVAYHCCGAHNGYQLVQYAHIIILETGPVFSSGILEQYLLVPSLAQREEKGQEERAEKKPRGNRHGLGKGGGAGYSP